MATEKAEPRVGLIVSIGIIAILIFGGVRTGLVAYFDEMRAEETYRKVGAVKPEALINMRADEKQRLSSGPMPIDQAMKSLVAKGRTGASPDIMPSASKDTAPLQGWTKMPQAIPSPMMAPSDAPAPPPAPSASASASAPPPAPAPRGNH
jgi:hypothetical protein